MGSMDSPWSWVVCAVTFFSHIVAVGFSYAISVYYVEFLTVFNESSGTTSWLSSLNYGILCLMGPVASMCNERFSTRVTMFIGGILSAVGLLLTVFATEFYMVLLSFGVLTGVGFGLSYTAAIVVIGEHFYKYRSLAFGISVAGGSFGNIAFPWISTALIDHFGWRGALLISSGFTLNLIVCAMFIKKPSEKDSEIPIEVIQEQRKKSLKSWSGYYFQNEEYCIDDVDQREYFWNIKRLVSIHECPVAFEDYKMSTDYINTTETTTDNNVMKNTGIRDGVILNVGGLNNEAYESSTDNLENGQETQIAKLPTTNSNTNGVINNGKLFQKRVSVASRRGSRLKIKKQTSILDKNVREIMKENFKELYSNVYFILLLISLALFSFGTSIIFTHVLPYAESKEISSSIGLLLVSVLGGTGFLGNIGLGAFAQLPRVNAIVLYIVAVILCGLFMIAQAEWVSVPGFVICTSVFGFFSSAATPTANECIYLIAGRDMFNFGFGQAIVFMGVGWVVGAPAAGLLFDATMYYPSSFYFGGAVTLLGALVMIPVAVKELKVKK